jgi:hypothetical protein
MKPTLGRRSFCGPDQANGDDEGTITESEADKFALPKLTSSHYFWLTPGGDRESQSAVKRRIFHAGPCESRPFLRSDSEATALLRSFGGCTLAYHR